MRERISRFENRQEAPNVAFYQAYWLSQNAPRIPYILSFIVSRDPESGNFVVRSSAILKGRVTDGKTQNVKITFAPDASTNNDRAIERLHRAAADGSPQTLKLYR